MNKVIKKCMNCKYYNRNKMKCVLYFECKMCDEYEYIYADVDYNKLRTVKIEDNKEINILFQDLEPGIIFRLYGKDNVIVSDKKKKNTFLATSYSFYDINNGTWVVFYEY